MFNEVDVLPPEKVTPLPTSWDELYAALDAELVNEQARAAKLHAEGHSEQTARAIAQRTGQSGKLRAHMRRLRGQEPVKYVGYCGVQQPLWWVSKQYIARAIEVIRTGADGDVEYRDDKFFAVSWETIYQVTFRLGWDLDQAQKWYRKILLKLGGFRCKLVDGELVDITALKTERYPPLWRFRIVPAGAYRQLRCVLAHCRTHAGDWEVEGNCLYVDHTVVEAVAAKLFNPPPKLSSRIARGCQGELVFRAGEFVWRFPA